MYFVRKEVLKESNFREEPRDVVKARKLSRRKKEAEVGQSGAPMSLTLPPEQTGLGADIGEYLLEYLDLKTQASTPWRDFVRILR